MNSLKNNRFAIRNWSLRLKITMATVLLLTAVLVIMLILVLKNQRSNLIATSEEHAGGILNTIVAASADKIYFADTKYLVDLVQNVAQSQHVTNIRIVGQDGVILADSTDDTLRFTNTPDIFGQELLHSYNKIYRFDADHVIAGSPVTIAKTNIGAVMVTVSIADIQERHRSEQLEAMLISLLIIFIGGLLAWFIARAITQPFITLMAATKMMARGDLSQRLDLHRGDEFAVFAQSFNQMADAIQQRDTNTKALNQTLNERASELERIVRNLQETTAARDALNQTVLTLENPVIPILPGVLVLPLIGNITADRANHINQTLLDAIVEHRARFVILDITGVPAIDTYVGQVIVRLSQAVRLLGCKVIMSGMRPDIADTIVHLGIRLTDVATYADLQSAFQAILKGSKQ